MKESDVTQTSEFYSVREVYTDILSSGHKAGLWKDLLAMMLLGLCDMSCFTRSVVGRPSNEVLTLLATLFQDHVNLPRYQHLGLAAGH